MSQVLMITYDLVKEKTSEDYKEVLNIIKSYDFLMISESSYAIYTSDSPQNILDKIKKFIDTNDKVLIIKILNPKQGWLTEAQWKWLNDRL